MLGPRKGKLFALLNQKVRLVIGDGRSLVGTFLSFDRHLNIVLSHVQEEQTTTRVNEEGEEETRKRARPLGIVFVRGETVQSVVMQRKKKKKRPEGAARDPADAAAAPAGSGAGAAAAPKRKRDLDEAELMAERAAKAARGGAR